MVVLSSLCVFFLQLLAHVFVVSQQCVNIFPQLSCGVGTDNSEACTGAGCCWDGTECYIPSVNGYTYTESASSYSETSGVLDLLSASGVFNSTDFSQLAIEVTLETNFRTHITISPVGVERWEVPEYLIPRPGGVFNQSESSFPGIMLTDTSVKSNPFNILTTRTYAGVNPALSKVIFNMTDQLIFQDQYIQFVLATPGDVVATFGFGESTRNIQQLQVGETYALWNTDIGAATFNKGLYGSHPFFLQVKADGSCNGVMLMNSNAMQLTLHESASAGQRLAIQATGGLLDLYVFSGPEPGTVIRQYLQVIGRPALVPFWSLGFHNCRWGYVNLTYVEEVVANYSAAGIPLETQWADIDYMNHYLDFTTDPINFPEQEFASFVSTLHDNGQRFVPIVDPGIFVESEENPAYAQGMQQNVFLKDLEGVNNYLGQVWPGPTYFPDWFAENTTSWWTDQFTAFYDKIPFDGIWIDMNEVANFCNDGSAQVCELDLTCSQPDGCCVQCTTPQPDNTYDFPPFLPAIAYNALGSKTIPPSSLHAGGIVDYNAHNLYGFMESIATRQALTTVIRKRPFVLSRSTFAGSGVHTAHWTGDNAATWADLSASIISMNNMALFGIPMVGADICGFFDATTEELCARWIEVGAFSPFSRDHNTYDAPPQELYRWDTVAEASRTALGLRYRMLPYLYTLIYLAHSRGNVVQSALWMKFPQDPVTLSQTDGQFMWGSAVLFTPVLLEGATSVTGYFPQGLWYSLFGETYGQEFIDAAAGGVWIELSTPLTTTNAHLRGGHIIPLQQSAMTTTDVHASPFTLVAAVDTNNKISHGQLFYDDGEQLELTRIVHMAYEYQDTTRTFKSVALNTSYDLATALLVSIEIWGANVFPNSTFCSATLERINDKDKIDATTVNLVNSTNFTKVIISFSTDVAVNVGTEFDMTWDCIYADDVENKKSSNDDDGFGWNSIPKYGQTLIIVAASLIGVVAVIAVGYLVVTANKIQDSLLANSI